MKWKELKAMAERLGVKDDDEIGIRQNQQYACHSEACSLTKHSSFDNKWTLEDCGYTPNYISPCEDTGR